MVISLSKIIPYSTQLIWQVIGNPARADWVPNVTACAFDGKVRRLTMEGAGELAERIHLLDNAQKRIEYGLIESSAAITQHHASIQINAHALEKGATVSELIWEVEIQPADYAPFIQESMRLALRELTRVLEAEQQNSAPMKLYQATQQQLDPVAILFNKYRIFYERPDDLAGCRNYIEQRLANNESVIFVAENEAGDIVGFTQLYHSFCSVAMRPIVYLYDLFVDPTARRTGVGRALMQHAEAYSRDAGAARMQLDTAHDNVPGQSLYESLGWKRDTHFYAYQLRL